jgi:hypothetical protein
MRQTTTKSDNRKPGLDTFFHCVEKSKRFTRSATFLSLRLNAIDIFNLTTQGIS